jgi:CHAT domain-containing protein
VILPVPVPDSSGPVREVARPAAGPLPKAEALAEAKRWLRERTAGEIDDELARLTRGEIVRLAGVAPASSSRRYEHLCFWAGFILIGDSD